MITFESGQVIKGKYLVERVIGTGGMGVVFAARHLRLEEPVAIKLLHSWMVERPEAVERFVREARAASKLTSDHVVRVFDVDTLDSHAPFIVMEYLEGMDLGAILRVRGPLPVGEAVSYLLDTCEAISEAHALGIIHRDLKPQNLFIARRRDGSVRLKVLDFGISKIIPIAGMPSDGFTTDRGIMLGSPLYMAPEQLGSPRVVDAGVDIWALGVLLYQLLTAKMPFEGQSFLETASAILHKEPIRPREFCPDLPAELEETILRCLEKDPARRLGSAAELARALAPFAERWGAGASDAARKALPAPPPAPTMTELTPPPGPTRVMPTLLEGQGAPPDGQDTSARARPTRPRQKRVVLLALLAAVAALLTAGAVYWLRPAGKPALAPQTSSVPLPPPPAPTSSLPPLPPEAPATPPTIEPSPPERSPSRAAPVPRRLPAPSLADAGKAPDEAGSDVGGGEVSPPSPELDPFGRRRH